MKLQTITVSKAIMPTQSSHDSCTFTVAYPTMPRITPTNPTAQSSTRTCF